MEHEEDYRIINFHLTQMLTGHEYFGRYLYCLIKLDNPTCVDCHAMVNDIKHSLFRCDRWWRLRRELEVQLGGDFEPDTIVELMTQSRAYWELVKVFLDKVLSTKEEKDRKRQHDAPV